MVIMGFDLITEAKDPIQAQIENDKTINRITTSLNEFGIRTEDIFSSINKISLIKDENNQITGYKASTIFTILFYDRQIHSEFLYNIRSENIKVRDAFFTVMDPMKHWNDAIEEVVINSIERAAVVAKTLDVNIESSPQDVIEITDPSDVLPRIYDRKNISDDEGFIPIYAAVKAKFLVKDESSQ